MSGLPQVMWRMIFWSYLQAHDVPILVCTPCANARQIKDEDLIDGARMASAAEFINLSCDATVISL